MNNRYKANLRYADAPSKLYLHDLFNSVQLKDIVKRNKIRDVDLLDRIIAYVIANVGTTFSASSLAKFFKNEQRTVAPETIQRKFGVYDNIRDNCPKYVVSLDGFDMSRNGSKHRSITDFLLAEEWN